MNDATPYSPARRSLSIARAPARSACRHRMTQWEHTGARGAADRPELRSGQITAVPAAGAVGRRAGLQGQGHLARTSAVYCHPVDVIGVAGGAGSGRAGRAAGLLTEIVVDSHERHPCTFAGQQVRTVRRGPTCGDYGRALRAGRGFGGAQVAVGPGLEPHRRQAPIRCRRAVHAVSRGGRGRGPLLAGVHPQAGPPQPWWPTAWPSCRSGGRTCRSCSARTASWPRSGPTGTSPPRARGPTPSVPR